MQSTTWAQCLLQHPSVTVWCHRGKRQGEQGKAQVSRLESLNIGGVSLGWRKILRLKRRSGRETAQKKFHCSPGRAVTKDPAELADGSNAGQLPRLHLSFRSHTSHVRCEGFAIARMRTVESWKTGPKWFALISRSQRRAPALQAAARD